MKMHLFNIISTTVFLLLCCKSLTVVQAQENITIDPCVKIPSTNFHLVNPRTNVISPLRDVINLAEYPAQAGFNILIREYNTCPERRMVKSMRIKYYFNGTLQRTSCETEAPYTAFGYSNVSGDVRFRLYPFPNSTTETNATIEAVPFLDGEACNGTVRGKLGRRSFRFVNSTVKGIKSFQTTEELRKAAYRWASGEKNKGSDLAAMYGHPIGKWDVSKITNFSFLFSSDAGYFQFRFFNEDISMWNVSSAVSMRGMFSNVVDFNGNLSSWDVSRVVDMGHMFKAAYSFNSDLSMWDVSKVVTMDGMFSNAISYSTDLSKWNVSSVTSMKEMFLGAENFRGNLSAWDVSSVNDMSSMFAGASLFDSDLSAWNVSATMDMTSMFHFAISLKSDLSQWDVSSVTRMNSMFFGALQFNYDLSEWDVSHVNDMNQMFYRAHAFDQNLCKWGSRLPNRTIRSGAFEMFAFTNCPSKLSPKSKASPPGPFCYKCT